MHDNFKTIHFRFYFQIIITFILLTANNVIANSKSGNDSLNSESAKLVEFTSSNLPIIVVNTHGQTIINEEKITADMGIIYNGEGERNNVSDIFNNYNGKIGIEIRGSSSQLFPKKQYAVETRDSLGEDLNVSILGFPEESDWVLYAPYSDKTLLRNVLTYKLYNEMGRYATKTKFCELVLNNEYMGVYVLMEKIKRDKNRVDIKKLETTDTTGNGLTGGYIIKIDKFDGEGNAGWLSPFLPYKGAWQKTIYQYHYPKPEDINLQQKKYIQHIIYQFEEKMNQLEPKADDSSYTNLVDINSLVDYFLINEITKNVDGYRLSLFLCKDRDDINDKLVVGPIWDYNIALGNSDYYDGWNSEGWELPLLVYDFGFNYDEFTAPFWWGKLYNNPYFMKKINERWGEIKTTVFDQQKILSCIDSMVTYLDESQKRNFQKWNILNTKIWPNQYVFKYYSYEISFLKTWIKNRINWMDQNISGLLITSLNENETAPSTIILEQNYPNPFNPTTKIKYTIPDVGNAYLHSLPTTLKAYDLLGREVATLVNENQKPGNYEVEFNATESAKNYSPLPSGVYFYQLKVGENTMTKKLLLLK